MSAQKLKKAALVGPAILAGGTKAVAGPAVDILIGKLKAGNDEERAEAWTGAWRLGAPIVKSLASVMTDENFQVARAAKRALWKLVRHVGRPGADRERFSVIAELLSLLEADQASSVRREVIWMLSEIAGDEAVPAVSNFLKDKELREDARMVLQRIPGATSLAALKIALNAVSDDFKINIVQSLRARGVLVPGHPCQKMVPTKQTQVKPIE